jgi:hypothetical protein
VSEGTSERPAPPSPPRGAGRARRPDGGAAEALAPDAIEALAPEEIDVLVRVREVLRRLRFGTVLLVVQDGRVVQVETAERFRL